MTSVVDGGNGPLAGADGDTENNQIYTPIHIDLTANILFLVDSI